MAELLFLKRQRGDNKAHLNIYFFKVRLEGQAYTLVAKDDDQNTLFERKRKGTTKDYRSQH
jgi:hypothetical protein